MASSDHSHGGSSGRPSSGLDLLGDAARDPSDAEVNIGAAARLQEAMESCSIFNRPRVIYEPADDLFGDVAVIVDLVVPGSHYFGIMQYLPFRELTNGMLVATLMMVDREIVVMGIFLVDNVSPYLMSRVGEFGSTLAHGKFITLSPDISTGVFVLIEPFLFC